MNRFQLANGWHEVYTPTKLVMLRGHFLTYDSLHLSDVACWFNVFHPNALINQHHESMQTMLSGMVYGIATCRDKCLYHTLIFSWLLFHLQFSGLSYKATDISMLNDPSPPPIHYSCRRDCLAQVTYSLYQHSSTRVVLDQASDAQSKSGWVDPQVNSSTGHPFCRHNCWQT